MFEFFIIILCVVFTCWYLREPQAPVLPPKVEVNLNPAVDEWNALEMVEVESENFYE